MARRIMAGAVLALIALGIGLALRGELDADAAVTYTPHRGNLSFAECLTDTTNATGYDSVRFQCDVVSSWTISTRTADVEYWFKSVAYDTASAVDGAVVTTVSSGQTWHVPPTWVKVRAVSGSPQYTIRVEGVELAWDAGAGIHDITNAIE